MTIEMNDNKKRIASSFSHAAPTYDKAAIVQNEIGQRLLTRLKLMKTAPRTILDVGAGTGRLTQLLQQTYPKSQVIGLDIAKGMMQYAHMQQPRKFWRKAPTYLCGDLESLPLRNNTIDLIFSNFSLQWSQDLPRFFAECKRVLKPNGAIYFTTLGPQTLFELKQSWKEVDSHIHVNEFIDMHDVGDMLLNSGLHESVIDMEMITVCYKTVQRLLLDLKETGAHHVQNHPRQGLMTPENLKRLDQAYERFQTHAEFPATFEVIYGHALKLTPSVYQAKDGVVSIPADRIPILKPIA